MARRTASRMIIPMACPVSPPYSSVAIISTPLRERVCFYRNHKLLHRVRQTGHKRGLLSLYKTARGIRCSVRFSSIHNRLWLMKYRKSIFVSIALPVLVAPFFVFAQAGNTIVAGEGMNVKLFVAPPQKGQKSEAVRDLQRILSTDPAIYPKGMVTGYYGPLTEQAVKRVQERYGLPSTGVVDEATQSIIMPPHIKLSVLRPNGGEIWDRSVPQSIQWETYSGPVMIQNRQLLPEADSAKRGVGAPADVMPHIYPLFRQVSLDLVRDSNPGYIYHIGTVDLYQSSYTWSIPQDVASGNDFRVRISVGGHVPCVWAQDMRSPGAPSVCPLYFPAYSAADTSDGVFTISGDVTPNPDVILKLKAQVSEMEATLTMLLRQIQAMKELLAKL